MISFAWPNGPSGRRQIIGKSDKRGFYWHFGVTCSARSAPMRHIRVGARVIFTTNGVDLYGDAARLHRLRRSFCKGWRNDKWRDLLLTFLYWIGGGAEFLDIPFGEDAIMRLRLPPIGFDASFGIDTPDDAVATDDDEDDGGEEGDYAPDESPDADEPDGVP
jgi:hypothetical protein